MLGRAMAEAERRGIRWIEFTETDVEALPFEDESFDLVVSYTGLHCFPDPAKAVNEMARVLRPGGELRGSCVVRGAGLRQDAFVRLAQAAGVFGPGGTREELVAWLGDAGLVAASVQCDGALAFFAGRRPSGGV
jgi:SAM-dependent methyltransferase